MPRCQCPWSPCYAAARITCHGYEDGVEVHLELCDYHTAGWVIRKQQDSKEFAGETSAWEAGSE